MLDMILLFLKLIIISVKIIIVKIGERKIYAFSGQANL